MGLVKSCTGHIPHVGSCKFPTLVIDTADIFTAPDYST
jgi:hypothetical protein